MRALVGGINASELSKLSVSDAVRDALIGGAVDPHPKARWWSLQLLDHLPDPAVLQVIAQALDDPVPRVRRQAANALGCRMCKPDWDGALPTQIADKLAQIAASEVNLKVRAEARAALACTTPRTMSREPVAGRCVR
jgi:hypothetical protein